MKVSVRTKNQKNIANEATEKKTNAPAYIIKDYDEDGTISAAVIMHCLTNGVLPQLNNTHSQKADEPRGKAAFQAKVIKYYLDRGMLPPIIDKCDPPVGIVFIR